MRKSPVLILLLVFLGTLLVRESRRAPGSIADTYFADWLAANSEANLSPAPVALVEIDDESISSNHPWPWPPVDFALFIQAALNFQSEVIAIEPVLNWPEPNPVHAQSEKLLHQYLLRAPKMLLGAQLGALKDEDVVPPMEPVPILRRVSGDRGDLAEFSLINDQPKEEFRLSPALGFTNLGSENRVNRSVPLIFRYRGEVVPSFVLQAATLWLKLTPDDVQVECGSKIRLGDSLSIPIDERGRMQVDFRTPYTRLSFEELMLGAQQTQAATSVAVPVEKLRGSVALMARTDAPARSLQFSNGRRGSSGELIASAIATIQNRNFTKRAPAWADALILLGACVFGHFLLPRDRQWAVLAPIAVFTLYIFGCLLVFQSSFVALPILLPAGLLAFTSAFCFLVKPHV